MYSQLNSLLLLWRAWTEVVLVCSLPWSEIAHIFSFLLPVVTNHGQNHRGFACWIGKGGSDLCSKNLASLPLWIYEIGLNVAFALLSLTQHDAALCHYESLWYSVSACVNMTTRNCFLLVNVVVFCACLCYRCSPGTEFGLSACTTVAR